jgi:hypothetical protein
MVSPRQAWRSLPARAAPALALSLTLGILLLLIATATVHGAEPSPSPLALLAGDPRSEGSGPGLVGSPLGVLFLVVALGMATVVVTALLARLTRRS